MQRNVGTELHFDVKAPSRLALQIGVADVGHRTVDEELALTVDGAAVAVEQLPAPTGGRVWVAHAPAGTAHCRYHASVEGGGPPPPVDPAEELLYLRPSRYCESDRLEGFAGRLFGDVSGPADVLAAVSSWVGTQLEYVLGSSGPTDGAVDTLLAGRGVCRDFAHLTVALLRAREIPARLVAVFAPGLEPMDFHAVAEALVDGAWCVVDSTLLAPRSSLLRIATGRDAADTSFLTNHGGRVDLTGMEVWATVDGDLPADDVTSLVQLG